MTQWVCFVHSPSKEKCCLEKPGKSISKWDDPLPNSLKSKWIKFLCSIYDLHNLVFPRSIKPPGAIGEPILVLMSDASDKAYGVVAYARWNCEDGTYK